MNPYMNPYGNNVAVGINGLLDGYERGMKWNNQADQMELAKQKQAADEENQRLLRSHQMQQMRIMQAEQAAKEAERARMEQYRQEAGALFAPRPLVDGNIPTKLGEGLLSQVPEFTQQENPKYDPFSETPVEPMISQRNPQWDATLQAIQQQGSLPAQPSPQDLMGLVSKYGPPSEIGNTAKELGLFQKPDALTAKDLLAHADKYGPEARAAMSRKLGIPLDLPAAKQDMKTEETYDSKNHVTMGRDFYWQGDKKVYVGEPRPIKGRESIQIGGMNGSAGEYDQQTVNFLAEQYVKTGQMPPLGIKNPEVRKQILTQAAIFAKGDGTGTVGDVIAGRASNKALTGSLAMQEKQIGQMGSFVKNMDAQIGRVAEIGKELSTFDTRLLNMPLRAVRGKIAGSPLQAKYDMYLTEIENEMGKLSTGSAASISELSVGAQQKWEKIHDKNLSINDMLSLLQESSHAGKLRMKSVIDQSAETKARLSGGTVSKPASTVPQSAIDYLRADPRRKIYFEQKYGKGSADEYLR